MRKSAILLENQSCNSKPYDSHLLARQLSALHHRGGVSGAFAESDRPLLQPERCRDQVRFLQRQVGQGEFYVVFVPPQVLVETR